MKSAAFWLFGLIFGAALALPTASHGQSGQSTSDLSKSKASVPVAMKECEGATQCASWSFLGTQGNGQGASGEVENLSVERFDANSVVIRRADSTGTSAGLTADYVGTRHGNHIEGTYHSSWPGHWDSMSGKWSATLGTTSSDGSPNAASGANGGLDGVMVGRWGTGHLLFTFDDGKTVAGNDYDSNGYNHIFSGRYVAANRIAYTATRIDPNGCRTSTTGTIRVVDRNNLDTAQQGWNGCGVSTGNVTGHLTRAPAGAPRPQQQQLVVCVPWFFTIVCGR
jgi:hypothetical protein